VTFGLRTWSATGELLFDSQAENTLFFIEERTIVASTVGSGLNFDYSAYTGKKIAAFLTPGYPTGDFYNYAVLSCRVSYPSGVPRVTVSFANDGMPGDQTDGYLLVFFTGANQ